MKKGGRKRIQPPVNNTVYPQYVIERFARCIIDDIRADFENPEVQEQFKRWMMERKSESEK